MTGTNTMNLDLNNCRIELVCGDITDQEIDAIVNAANASLAGAPHWELSDGQHFGTCLTLHS